MNTMMMQMVTESEMKWSDLPPLVRFFTILTMQHRLRLIQTKIRFQMFSMMIMITMDGQMMSNSIEVQISMIKMKLHSIFILIAILDSSIQVVCQAIHSVQNTMLRVLKFRYLLSVKSFLKNWLFLFFLFRFTLRFSSQGAENTRSVS